MTYEKTVPSTLGVVTVEDMKSYLRVSFPDDDVLIESLITAATDIAERFMNITILTTTWINRRSSFFDDMTLTRAPFQVVDKIEVLQDGSLVTIPSTDYEVQKGGLLGVICSIEVGLQFDDSCNAIEITFQTGFGDDASFVPEAIKIGIKQIVAWLYENKGDCGGSSTDGIPFTAKAILRKYKYIDIIGDSRLVCV